MSSENRRRWKLTALKISCALVVLLLGVAVLEGTARYLGLGDPVLYYNDAWGGLRPLPNQKHSRLGGAIVTIDANGFRTAVPDTPGALRVLYLGDSVTWGGSSVDDRDLFTEVAANVIRGQGRGVYAMNAGVNATALVNHAEVFQRYVDQNGKLDAVVWLFPWGDVDRAYFSGGILWPARYKPKFALVEAVDYLIKQVWVNALREGPSAKDDFLTPHRAAGQELSFDEQQVKARQERNLDAVRNVVAEARRHGVPLIIGVTPYRNDDGLHPLPEEAVALLADVAGDGVTVFDVSAALTDESGSAAGVFLDHVHVSKEGHRRVGRSLGAVLNDLLPADED